MYDKPRPKHPDYPHAPAYESLTPGGVLVSIATVPLFVALLAAPALVVAATLGAATVPLFERAVRFYEAVAVERREDTVESTTA
jgi:hypothetical protein